MKKILLMFVVLTFATTSMAQEIVDHTIGLRLGNYYGVSYQKKLSDDSRAEINLAWRGYSTYSDTKADAFYQKVFNFEPVDEMNWYLGAGGGVGFWKYDSHYYSYYDHDDDYDDSGTYFFVGGVAGIEYKFDFPLLLSLDLRPELSFGDFHNGFHIGGGLGIRYTL